MKLATIFDRLSEDQQTAALDQLDDFTAAHNVFELLDEWLIRWWTESLKTTAEHVYYDLAIAPKDGVGLKCKRCGLVSVLGLPAAIHEVTWAMLTFSEEHVECDEPK
jgi:hypothetical protein